ncbi:MAG TPA: copper resistance CopC family protein [Acetobacteraceae bacterium]|nr:copper resistance CopC family protein [Acetobacteraceae bacterium]
MMVDSLGEYQAKVEADPVPNVHLPPVGYHPVIGQTTAQGVQGRGFATAGRIIVTNRLTKQIACMGGAVLLLTGLAPAAASAHAILEDSRPVAGGKVPAGTIALHFRYNSRIDRSRSRLTLTGPDGKHVPLKIKPEGPPDIIDASAALTPGSYVVRWQVLAIDGHITRGDVPFTVTGQ